MDSWHSSLTPAPTTGAAISGSFLFIVGVANSIILYRIINQRRRVRIKACTLFNSAEISQDRMQGTNSTPASPASGGEEAPSTNDGHLSRPHHHGNTLLMKIIGPVITFVDRPWKVNVVSTWSKRKLTPQDIDVSGGTTVRFR